MAQTTAFERRLATASGPHNACYGKVAYGTRWLATIAAYRMEELKPGEDFAPYGCVWCGMYHVGHYFDPKWLDEWGL